MEKIEKLKSSKHKNLLYINQTYYDIKFSEFKEPYGLLYNNLNGILKNKDFELSLGIEEEALEKIIAIIIYQYSFDSLIFSDFRDVWNGYRFRLAPYLLSYFGSKKCLFYCRYNKQ